MGTLLNGDNIEDADIIGEHFIKPEFCFCMQLATEIEMEEKLTSMNHCICSATTNANGIAMKNMAKIYLQYLLYGFHIGLTLPTPVVKPFVSNVDEISQSFSSRLLLSSKLKSKANNFT
jgi:hypothetical protein